MRTIRGKRALVTGAASGIGRAVALALAGEGADLFLLDIDGPRLREVAAEARQLGVSCIARRCDVASPVEITSAVGALLRGWGQLDILVNNAGVAYYGPTMRMSAEQWDRLLAVNLHAPIQFSRELLPTLLTRPEAHILNVSSICGLVAGGRLCAYHTSKFGLVGFSEALRAEYARSGLGVSALCPGLVRTNFFQAAASGRRGKAAPTPPAWICSSPQRVARKAVRAIRRNRRLVLVSPLAYALYYSKRIAPGLLDSLHRIGRKRRPQEQGDEAPSIGPPREDEVRDAA